MSDEPIEGLSDSVAITKSDLPIFADVDEIVGKAVTIGDPLLAFQYGERLVKDGVLRGLALAKLLYRLNESWNLFEAGGIEDDLETMAYAHIGVKPQTTRKYIRMWEAIFENEAVNDDTKNLLRGRPIKELMLLTAAVREGSIEGQELKEIALGVGGNELRDRIRDARGSQTSSNTAIRFFLQMQDTPSTPAGTLFVRRNGKMDVIGTLDIMASGDSLIGMAVAKLVNAMGIQEQYGV